MLNKDIVAGATMVVAGGWFAWEAQSFPKLAGLSEGPGLFPTIAGVGLVICGTLILLTGVLKHAAAAGPAEAPPRLSRRAWVNSAAIVVGVVLFALFLDPLGFHLVAFPLMLALLLLFGIRWGKALALAAGVTVLVHFIFYSFLHVPLPWGLLEPIAW